MSNILDSVRDVVVVNANHIALELSVTMRDGPVGELQSAFGGNHEVGYFYLYRHPKHPDTVMETVISREHKDGITSLYKGNHRIFASNADLMRARASLIAALAADVGLPAESIGIDDEARGRQMSLIELGTGQIIDLLQDRARCGIVTMKSDNYANGEVFA